jgi:hypothetical protein
LEYRAYVVSPRPITQRPRVKVRDVYNVVEQVIQSETKHLPSGADPEDFAQDMREQYTLKSYALASETRFVVAFAVHRWALNWCRAFMRHAGGHEQSVDPESDVLDSVSVQGADAIEALCDLRRLAHSHPEWVEQALTQV